MKTYRKLCALFLCLALCLSLLPAAALAEENSGDFSAAGEETGIQAGPSATPETALTVNLTANAAAAVGEEPETEETQATGTELPAEETMIVAGAESAENNDELFASYVDQAFLQAAWGENPTLCSTQTAGDKLEGQDFIIYCELKEQIAQVASGDLASTEFTVKVSSLLSKTQYGSADFGVNVTADNISELYQSLYTFTWKNIDNALLADCSYELYWFDKTVGVSYSTPGCTYWTYESSPGMNYLEIAPDAVITFSLAVSSDYSADTYVADTTKTGAATQAAANAKTVVDAAAGLSDYDKLDYYRGRICELASYNYYAADENNNVPYGDPWQLIWVFDGDDTTKVVCEGYSKAFKYLCEMTSFESPEICCITVSGSIIEGPHMWNIVHMDDGCNYLVDVTNCDSNYASADFRRFFLRPVSSGNVAEGYVVYSTTGDSEIFTYDDETLSNYAESRLTLSFDIYHLWQAWETAGDGLTRTRICRICSETQTCLVGDCNGDNLVNLQDLLVMKKYLSDSASVSIRTYSADMDGTGQVNLLDLLMLSKRLTESASA